MSADKQKLSTLTEVKVNVPKRPMRARHYRMRGKIYAQYFCGNCGKGMLLPRRPSKAAEWNHNHVSKSPNCYQQFERDPEICDLI